jgi:hypothetical protein
MPEDKPEPNYKDTGLIVDIHYYTEEGRVIFTKLFHKQRGSCCGNNCRHCPYIKPSKRGNKILEESNQ